MIKLLARFPYAFFFALDLMVSALALGNAGETLSARLGAARLSGSETWTPVANALDWFVLLVFGEKKHCDRALRHYELWVNTDWG